MLFLDLWENTIQGYGGFWSIMWKRSRIKKDMSEVTKIGVDETSRAKGHTLCDTVF